MQKNTTTKKIAQMMRLRRKTPLKPPLGGFLKKGGVSKPPTLSDFSGTPPPWQIPTNRDPFSVAGSIFIIEGVEGGISDFA